MRLETKERIIALYRAVGIDIASLNDIDWEHWPLPVLEKIAASGIQNIAVSTHLNGEPCTRGVWLTSKSTCGDFIYCSVCYRDARAHDIVTTRE